MNRFTTVLGGAVAVGLLLGGAAAAQTLSGIAGQLLGGQATQGQQAAPAAPQMPGVSSLLGQALPNVSSAGADNVTGVLSYCVQTKVLSGGNAASLLGSLTGRGDVRSSAGFQAGQQGLLQTGGGNDFSLASLKDQVKSKLCDMVLQRAQSLL